MKPRIKEVIVVEGRYDRNALAQVVDATVVETGGFSVFNNREKLAFLRRLAEKPGAYPADGPGRRRLRDPELSQGRHSPAAGEAGVYPRCGREGAAQAPPRQGGKAGRGGDAPGGAAGGSAARGATFQGEEAPVRSAELTQGGHDGEGTGGAGLRRRRQQVLKELELPEHLTANGLLEAMNLLLSRGGV